MSSKRIMIVDDEKSILTVLKNSLKKIRPHDQIVTVTNGFAALDALLAAPFDVVITDYNMPDMDGVELMEAIHYAQPDARLILITAYGNEFTEAEAKRLQVFRYLTKPLEIGQFRQIVEAAIEPTCPANSGLTVWSEKKYREINRIIDQLRSDVSASAIFVTNNSANIITKTGHTGNLHIENIASLLCGGIATLLEAGRSVDGDTDAIHMAYREGKNDDLYAINIGQQYLLILVINRGPYSSRLGSVWYHARQAAINLQEALNRAELDQPEDVFTEELDQAFNAELDKLFCGSNALL